MKKSLLTLLAASTLCAGAYAQVETPTIFSEDFVEMGISHDFVTDGWTTYGVDALAVDMLQGYYPKDNKDANAYMLLNYGAICIPMACTQFTPPTEADQWLISPEIEIPATVNDAVLSFTACVYTANGALGVGANPFKIYVSTTGTDKADFGEPIFEGTVKGSASTEMVQKQFCVPANGFGGKKVHIAFVAGGKDVGMTGFTNIALGNYYIDFTNTTPIIGEIGESYSPRVNVKMKTPVACPGITVIPYINDEKKDEVYYKKEFGGKSTSPTLQLVTLTDLIKIEDNKAVNYRLEFIPDFEGAPASSLTGSIGVPEFKYINNVVIEELTASGCGWCPRGIAALEYYKDTYPGTDTQGKVISIGIHSNMNYPDPMNQGVADYVAKIMDLNNTTSLPQAIFNRKSVGREPHDKSVVEEYIANTSNNEVKITSVEYPRLAEGQIINGRDIKVKFDAKNSYTAESVDLSAAVVLIENDVKGNNSGYSQENYLSNQGPSFIISNYGEWLLPYAQKFLQGGEFGVADISFEKMVYQHVARGIWPSFYGEKLNAAWTADVAQDYEISLTVPETVMKWENVEAVVLVFRNGITNGKRTCEIVASDIMPYSLFTIGSGVATVDNDNVKVAREGSNLVVAAEAGSNVTVYNVQGQLLGSYNVANGNLTVNASDWNGMVIVKVANDKESVAKKLVF